MVHAEFLHAEARLFCRTILARRGAETRLFCRAFRGAEGVYTPAESLPLGVADPFTHRRMKHPRQADYRAVRIAVVYPAMVRLILFIALLLPVMPLQGQLVINEMVSSNSWQLQDQFGVFPDWLEVVHTGSDPVQMDRYYLSDDTTRPLKWQFPAMTLQPGGYLVVFASGNDLPVAPRYWHTVIGMGDSVRYLLPSAEIGDAWKDTGYDDHAWPAGKSGIGYSDGDDSTVVSTTMSVYLRKTFSVDRLEEIRDVELHMDYDDSFVAYINGTEIARSNLGASGSDVAFDQAATGLHEALMYRGESPEVYPVENPATLLNEGENVLAVEVHNISTGSSDLTAIPFLVFGMTARSELYRQGNPYITLRNVYPHANFSIDKEGEQITLTEISGVLADSLYSGGIPPNHSYGRVPGAPGTWGYFSNPTPAAPNETTWYTEYHTDSVQFSHPGGNLGGMGEVELSGTDPGDSIYYTVDGSVPDTSDILCTGAVPVNGPTVIRAVIHRAGALPGPVATRTFIPGRDHDIAVASIAMEPHDLWDYEEGIYVMGPNADESNPHFGANFWQDWEKPAHIELYDEQGERMLAQDAGTKIYGAWSRAHAQKSMSFFARRAYGDGSFSYRLFPTKPMEKYEAFILRNSGNDWSRSMMRDAFTAVLARELGVDHQAHRPAAVYLNGEYWGLLNMREKINEHFVAGNHRRYADSINLLERNRSVIEGSGTAYQELMQFVTTENMTGSEAFEEVAKRMDLDNYARYWNLQVYIDNKDWPGNNIKYWSARAPGSQFRWIIYDTDFGYSIYDNSAYVYNTLEFSLGEGDEHNWANPDWATLLTRRLLENSHFRHLFVNHAADMMNTTLKSDRCLARIDSLAGLIESEMPYHCDRWEKSVWDWNNHVGRMKHFMEYRMRYVRDDIMDYFELEDTVEIRVDVSEPEAGRVRVNSIYPGEYPFEGVYFRDVPVQLEAEPAPGYTFSHWEGTTGSQNRLVDYSAVRAGSFRAFFHRVDDPDERIVINEIAYNASPDWNTEDWVELYNDGNVPVDLNGWVLSDNDFSTGTVLKGMPVLAPGEYAVVCRSERDFRNFYPEREPVRGEMGFGLAGEGELVVLYEPGGSFHDRVGYLPVAPWPAEANGEGATLELTHPGLDNNLAGNWKASLGHGTPCLENSRFDATGREEPGVDHTPAVQVFPTHVTDYTTVQFRVRSRGRVRIAVYGVTGRVQEVLLNSVVGPGEYFLDWHAEGVAPGVYVVRAEVGGGVGVFRVVVSR